jgi:ArsR family transcriptional regulator
MHPPIFFKCLADDTRFQIIMLLQQHKELCVCDLIEHLNLSQPKISRHLALLRKGELLIDQRKGKWVYYRINPDLALWCKNTLQGCLDSNKTVLSSLLTPLSTQACCE